MPFTEDQLLPLSALQHYLFCPRQCALIHLEQSWKENIHTAEGRVLHEKAHGGSSEFRQGVHITRSLSVRSLRLGLVGQCDIVEFHPDSRVLPVEYKKGKPKSHQADQVQVCAQALCLEEMFSLPDGVIQEAHLYYGEKMRRTIVSLDADLRYLTQTTAQGLHLLISQRQTPMASYEPHKCDSCSLFELCQPKALRLQRGAQAWFLQRIRSLP